MVILNEKFIKMRFLLSTLPGLICLFCDGSQYSLEYALTGHQTHHLQSHSYDLVVGSEYPAVFGLGRESYEINASDFNHSVNLSQEHAFLDLLTDYLSGESAILLQQGAPLQEPFLSWKHAKWFGYYQADQYPWVYSFPLGWLYVQESLDQGVWVWHGMSNGQNKLGWMWTDHMTFPYFYVSSINRWICYGDSQNIAAFYDYDQQEWFDSNTPLQVSFLTNLANAGNVYGTGLFYRWHKTQISVSASLDHTFIGWAGDYRDYPESFELEVLKDVVLQANFVPMVTEGTPVSEVLNHAVDLIESMDNLTEIEKERSIAELLKFGVSETAGFSILPK